MGMALGICEGSRSEVLTWQAGTQDQHFCNSN